MRAGGIGDSSRRRRSRQSPKVRQKKDRLSTTPIEESAPSTAGGAVSAPAAPQATSTPQATTPATATLPNIAQEDAVSEQASGMVESIPEEGTEGG